MGGTPCWRHLALKHFVAVCGYVVRRHDVVGHVGGEEFALLLLETNHDAAMEAAERFRRSIQELPVEAGPGLGMFYSIINGGVAPTG